VVYDCWVHTLPAVHAEHAAVVAALGEAVVFPASQGLQVAVSSQKPF
jgi:hypothetical protein